MGEGIYRENTEGKTACPLPGGVKRRREGRRGGGGGGGERGDLLRDEGQLAGVGQTTIIGGCGAIPTT